MGILTRRIGKSIDFVDGRGYANLPHKEGVRLLFERLNEYEELGTVDEFAELKELQIPKKPIRKEVEGGFIEICGNCKIVQVFDMYCERCGHRVGHGELATEQSNLPWE